MSVGLFLVVVVLFLVVVVCGGLGVGGSRIEGGGFLIYIYCIYILYTHHIHKLLLLLKGSYIL